MEKPQGTPRRIILKALGLTMVAGGLAATGAEIMGEQNVLTWAERGKMLLPNGYLPDMAFDIKPNTPLSLFPTLSPEEKNPQITWEQILELAGFKKSKIPRGVTIHNPAVYGPSTLEFGGDFWLLFNALVKPGFFRSGQEAHLFYRPPNSQELVDKIVLANNQPIPEPLIFPL